MTTLTELEVGRGKFKANPWPVYRQLRDQQPVVRIRLFDGTPAVMLTRHSEVSAMFKDARLVKDAANISPNAQSVRVRNPPKFARPLTRNMLALDDPDHVRLKRLVMAAFTPTRVQTLVSSTQAASLSLLDELVKGQRFDLMKSYALPLPVRVISDLLGVPAKDRERFAGWSRALIQTGSTRFGGLRALPQIYAFLQYLKKLLALKVVEPGDDLITDLVQDSQEEKLNEEELMAMVAILVSAGHETTTNFIGNATLALFDYPEERERLIANPRDIDRAVEELLRMAGPVEMSTPRYAKDDMRIAEFHIAAGTQVYGAIASANRDENHFPNAECLDLARPVTRHLTFGEGSHYCVGAALARMEGKVAITHLFEHYPELKLDGSRDDLNWKPHHILRGVKSLPVTYNRTTSRD